PYQAHMSWRTFPGLRIQASTDDLIIVSNAPKALRNERCHKCIGDPDAAERGRPRRRLLTRVARGDHAPKLTRARNSIEHAPGRKRYFADRFFAIAFTAKVSGHYA